jgi:Predicted DNA modification methylase
MTYIYRLAGENLELAKAELQGFLKSQKINEKPNRHGRLAETQKHPNQYKRLALTHEITQKITETNTEQFDDFEPGQKPEKSFSITCKVLEGEEKAPKIEEKLGKKYSTKENTVDLEQPVTKIYAYIQNEKIIIGKLVQDINRGLFDQRSNEKRPFSSPVSMDPVTARVLINLSETPAGKTILDPFCGTGGILIEAGLCGILPLGTDTKKEMVNGTQKNLEEYGIISHKIERIDSEKSLEKFNNIRAIVTDLPYGKSSKIEGKIKKKFKNLIERFEGKIVFMYDEPEFCGLEPDFEIYIHDSLTRYVYDVG